MSLTRFFLLTIFAGGAVSPAGAAFQTREIRYGFSVENTTDHPVEGATLWAYAPVKKTSRQECVSLTSSHPHEVTVDARGNQLLRFSLDTLPPFGVREVRVNAVVHMREASGAGRDRLSRAMKKRLLSAGALVEVEAPAVAALSMRLKSPGATPENIHRWVSENLRYAGHQVEARGALRALKEGEGDCTEAMHLFMALARSAGVPTRGAGGYVLAESAALAPEEHHNWAEFHDGRRWRVADPQKRVFASREAEYIVFKLMDGQEDPQTDFHRFRHDGEGLRVRMTR